MLSSRRVHGETKRWCCCNGYGIARIAFSRSSHDELGLVLHPFDLATNKVLALVGRVEVRDWIDVINCDEKIQPLGYLAWAACGKDPGFSPAAILEQAGRSARYSAEEVLELSFDGEPPDPGALSRRWHEALESAKRIVALLPPAELGKCVLTREGELYTGAVSDIEHSSGELAYHAGSIRGAFPRVLDES